jgi:hypothetical protein
VLERECILAAANVASIDTAQAERFQVADQRAVAGTRLGKGSDATAAKMRKSAAPQRPVASGRSRPRGARSWIAFPPTPPIDSKIQLIEQNR